MTLKNLLETRGLLLNTELRPIALRRLRDAGLLAWSPELEEWVVLPEPALPVPMPYFQPISRSQYRSRFPSRAA